MIAETGSPHVTLGDIAVTHQLPGKQLVYGGKLPPRQSHSAENISTAEVPPTDLSYAAFGDEGLGTDDDVRDPSDTQSSITSRPTAATLQVLEALHLTRVAAATAAKLAQLGIAEMLVTAPDGTRTLSQGAITSAPADEHDIPAWVNGNH